MFVTMTKSRHCQQHKMKDSWKETAQEGSVPKETQIIPCCGLEAYLIKRSKLAAISVKNTVVM